MDKADIKKIVISDEEEREQRIHELIRCRKAIDINTEMCKNLKFGDRAADKMAKFAGSWSIVIIFSIVVIVWAIINTELILRHPFDPFPYVFLNLILACTSAVQGPIIMMSQNRESQKDRMRAENDYMVNLKSEIILEDLHNKIDEIINQHHVMEKELTLLRLTAGSAEILTAQMDDILSGQRALAQEIREIKTNMDKIETQIVLRSDLDGKINTNREKPELYS